MRIVPTLLAVGLALSSVSASGATNTKQNKQPAASTTAPATSPADRKYCLESGNDATGTRLYTRECRTKADWAKRGVDVDELSKPD